MGTRADRVSSALFRVHPNLNDVFLYLNRNTENMFSISLRKFCDKKVNTLFNFIIKMKIIFAHSINMSAACESSAVLSS